MNHWKAVAVALAVCASPACSHTPTSPTTTTTTPTTPTTAVVEPTISEEFAGTLGVGASAFYSFTVQENGTVRVTLSSVGGSGVPSTLWLGLGLGQPSGEDCVTTTSMSTQAGSSAQLSGTYAPSVYCARVWDIGNLAAPARFVITIDHP